MGEVKRLKTNITLPAHLAQEAKSLGVNLSRAAEDGIAAAVKASRRSKWLEDNKAGIDSFNDWVRQHGMPLDDFQGI